MTQNFTHNFTHLQPLVPIRVLNFHNPGELVFFDKNSFAPFINIVGKPGHYGQSKFRAAKKWEIEIYINGR